MSKSTLILIAGPYRSGTGDDPEKIAANVRQMESQALPVFRLGHVPVLGESLALPLVDLADSEQAGDKAFNQLARQRGLQIYTIPEQIPPAG